MDDSLEMMPQSQNPNYLSGSEESLSKYVNEPVDRYSRPYSRFAERQPSPTYFQMRRRSSSPLQDDAFRQVQELHIDPRYRDTRPIARSSSNLALTMADTNCTRWDTTPSIYIEQYNDQNPVEVNSMESLNNTTSYSDAHQPLNEDSMASCADSDDIPFIDDGSPSDQDNIYIPPNIIVPKNSSKTGIMVDKSSTSRRSSSGCRKTVSFDLLDYNDRKTNSSDYVEYSFNKSKTCSVISDARLENFGTNTSDFDYGYDDIEDENMRNGIYSQDSPPELKNFDQNELKLDLSHVNSTSSSSTNEASEEDVKEELDKIEIMKRNYQVPLKKSNSSFDICSPYEADLQNRKFGDGKVKVLAKYFEHKSLKQKCKSSPELNITKTNKLNNYEQDQILAQLKEWSIFGSKGREILPEKPCSPKRDTESIWKSEPTLFSYITQTQVPPQRLSFLRKTRHCNAHYINTVPLVNACYKSCPNLCKKPTLLHSSPFHSSRFMTLRKLKRHCKQKSSDMLRESDETIEPR